MDEARRILDAAERRSLSLPERGVEVALLDWGGDGPLALLHHANGFCKGVWGLVADGLRDDYRVVAMDARGHGDTIAPADAAFEWEEFVGDLGAVAARLCDEAGAPIALGLGHSFGGTSMLGASRNAPEHFERLVLVDPVIPFPKALLPPDGGHVRKLVDGALKRRSDWPDRDEARAWWAEREFFAAWHPHALDCYVLDGLRERPEGDVVLKCEGRVEAAVFENGGNVDVREWAPGHPVPCLWLWAAKGNFSREAYEALAATMEDARVDSVDAGHLAPMERPDLVVEAVRGSR